MKLQSEQKIEPGIVGVYRRPTFFEAIPTFGVTSTRWAMALRRMQAPLNCISFAMQAEGLEIGNARQWLAERFLESEARYLLFIGDDNLPEWNALLMLFEAMEADFSWDILSGLYHLKQPGTPQIVGWKLDQDGPIIPHRDFTPGEIVQVDVSGLDFCLIRKEAMIHISEQCNKPWFKTSDMKSMNDPDNQMINRYTEDAYFFNYCRKLGLKVGIHTGARVGHYDLITGVIY